MCPWTLSVNIEEREVIVKIVELPILDYLDSLSQTPPSTLEIYRAQPYEGDGNLVCFYRMVMQV